MAFQPALVLRYGVERAGDAVADVVADYIPYVQCGYDNAHGGVEDIEVVACRDIEA